MEENISWQYLCGELWENFAIYHRFRNIFRGSREISESLEGVQNVFTFEEFPPPPRKLRTSAEFRKLRSEGESFKYLEKILRNLRNFAKFRIFRGGGGKFERVRFRYFGSYLRNLRNFAQFRIFRGGGRKFERMRFMTWKVSLKSPKIRGFREKKLETCAIVGIL